ncbi:MAG TPA: hypothetical protein VHS52_03635 [Acidimicrobiales bacterium]|nr:hypothetical protein [Acidimicrobiales bacterium]
MARLVPSCVWRATPEVVTALDGRFGPPIDAYVNGAQVWLRDGPAGATIEWRLHPVAGYRRPPGVGTYEVFEAVADALAQAGPPPAPLDRLWDGLEAFPAYGDEVEPVPLAAACTQELGRAPDLSGLVDHEAIATQWESTQGSTSIVAALFTQLQPSDPDATEPLQ